MHDQTCVRQRSRPEYNTRGGLSHGLELSSPSSPVLGRVCRFDDEDEEEEESIKMGVTAASRLPAVVSVVALPLA